MRKFLINKTSTIDVTSSNDSVEHTDDYSQKNNQQKFPLSKETIEKNTESFIPQNIAAHSSCMSGKIFTSLSYSYF